MTPAPLSRAYWRRLATQALAAMPDRRGVKLLLRLHDRLYYFTLGVIKVTEGGVHPRHRLTDAHAFFLDHLRPSDVVLDVGCGYGDLAAALAMRAKHVTAIDPRTDAVARARQRFASDNLVFQVANFFSFESSGRYDIIVAANVLEHIEDRPAFLEKCRRLADGLLIRVPAVNRDWLVPYRRELGLEWRLHPDHHVEYSEASLREELHAGGWAVSRCLASYGALHCAAHRARGVAS